ncbi:MAG: carboxypeptidase-like regulatory domain-containing protein [Muribaculaceae bacterium]|nr:carboxypeptidase-like regulatory domain-containing protein [Muribaculaceae bacterium]
MNGKDICEALRNIRRSIASANDIDYTPAVCTHEGDCSGTCPRCESELRYIERQLLRRTAMGKKVAIAGLALGAASLMPMQAQQVVPTTPAATAEQPKSRIVDAAPGDTTAVVVRGKVFDKNDHCECIGASVILQGTKLGTATDYDGNFAIRVPVGSKLIISYVGYNDYEYTVNESSADSEVLIPLEDNGRMLMGEVVIVNPMPAVDADIYLPDVPR